MSGKSVKLRRQPQHPVDRNIYKAANTLSGCGSAFWQIPNGDAVAKHAGVERRERPSRCADVVIIGSWDGHDGAAAQGEFQCPFRQTKQHRVAPAGASRASPCWERPSPTCWGALIEAATIRHRHALRPRHRSGSAKTPTRVQTAGLQPCRCSSRRGAAVGGEISRAYPTTLNAGATSFMKRSISSLT